MRIAVIGSGYVGLVSAACFASKGHQVRCVDLDPQRVAEVNAGRSPFYEAQLEELLAKTVPGGLRATVDLAEAVGEAEVTLLAVGTPFSGGKSDLSQIEQATRQVGRALRGRPDYHLVIVKSTVLPGTTDEVVVPILEAESGRQAGRSFGVAMNPEFLREGLAVADFLQPDRVVMGGLDERCYEVQEELYADFPCPDKLRTTNATAEMIKFSSNTLLASLISFSNEIANLCETLPNVDVVDVLKGVHLDKRLSPLLSDGSRLTPGIVSYLMAGCGFGGSCLPKDARSLIAFGDARKQPMDMLRAAMRTNDQQPRRLVDTVSRHFQSLEGIRVTLLGLAFKPGTADIRQTPALAVARGLLERGAQLTVFDPAAQESAASSLGHESVGYATDLAHAVEGAEAIVVVTSWPEFSALPALLEGQLDPPLVVDGRRMFDKHRFARYEAVGLGRSRSRVAEDLDESSAPLAETSQGDRP